MAIFAAACSPSFLLRPKPAFLDYANFDQSGKYFMLIDKIKNSFKDKNIQESVLTTFINELDHFEIGF